MWSFLQINTISTLLDFLSFTILKGLTLEDKLIPQSCMSGTLRGEGKMLMLHIMGKKGKKEWGYPNCSIDNIPLQKAESYREH